MAGAQVGVEVDEAGNWWTVVPRTAFPHHSLELGPLEVLAETTTNILIVKFVF